jgi:chromosome segregation ATPase
MGYGTDNAPGIEKFKIGDLIVVTRPPTNLQKLVGRNGIVTSVFNEYFNVTLEGNDERWFYDYEMDYAMSNCDELKARIAADVQRYAADIAKRDEQARLDAARIAELETSNQQFRESWAQAWDERNELQKKLEVWETVCGNYAALTIECGELRERVKELEANQQVTEFTNKFMAENPGCFPSIDEMEKTIHTLRAEIERLKAERQASLDCLYAREKDCRTLRERNEVLVKQVEELGAKMVYHPQKELVEDRDKWWRIATENKKAWCSVVAENDKRTEERDKLRAELEDANRRIKFLEDQVLYVINKRHSERSDLEAELYELKTQLDAVTAERDELRAQLEAARAELESLKPKPVVEVRYMGINDHNFDIATLYKELHYARDTNLKLTFEDGKLVKAEVVGGE